MGERLNRLRAFAFVFIAVASVCMFTLSWSCSDSQSRYSGNVDSITVGYQLHVGSTLIHIAENQGIFISNGLNVTFKEFVSGAEAVNGLMRSEVDFSVAPEFVIVQHVLNKEGIRVLGSISEVDNTYLVARIDRGIHNPPDLKDKRIGIRQQASGRFYFGRFLELNGLSIMQVNVVDVNADNFLSAITDGEVDAVVTYPPYVDQLKQQLGEGAVVWPIQNSQPGYSLLVSRDDLILKHPDFANRFLKSLAQAEQYYVLHPSEVKAIVQNKLKLDNAAMETNWTDSQFSLSLNQSLVVALEDEARWMISNNLTTEKQVPNFNDYIYENALKAIKPEVVNIIH
jgi:ABC-type nitrate/sulfonate/bicarbonate transport system substrate-binding protein